MLYKGSYSVDTTDIAKVKCVKNLLFEVWKRPLKYQTVCFPKINCPKAAFLEKRSVTAILSTGYRKSVFSSRHKKCIKVYPIL